MKKLIFAAAAVAGMGAFALESANVVGYNEAIFPRTGFNIWTGQFGAMNKTLAEMTLADIVPNATFEWGSDELQLLNDVAGTDSTYYYAAPELAAENDMEAGWWLIVDGEPTEVANDVLVPFGASVAFNIASSGAGVISNGEVQKGSPAVACTVTGFNWIGNATPSDDFKLGDFVPNANYEWGTDELQIMNESAGTDSTYYYAAPELAAENDMEAGWWLIVDGEPTEVANEIPLAAGQGFALVAVNGGIEINMPEVLAAE